MLRDRGPFAAFAHPHHCSLAVYERTGRAIDRACPDTLPLDFRVQGKGRRGRRGQAQGNRVAERLAGKTEFQSDRILSRSALYRHLALTHPTRQAFRPRPIGGLQTALMRQGSDHPALRRLRQQAQGPVKIRLAAAIRSRYDIEPAHRHDQFQKGPVVGDGQGFQHRL